MVVRRPAMRFTVGVALLATSLIVAGCGGSGGGGGGGGGGQPNYSLELSVYSVSITQGSSANLTVSVSPVNGFSGSVAVSFSGLPSGVTALPATLSLSNSGSQTVQLSASSAAATVTSTVTVSTTSGSLAQSASFTLIVAGAPSFSLTTQPTSVTLATGVQQQVQVNALGANGFNSPISVTTSGAPMGVTVSPASFTIPAGGSTTIDIAAAAGAAAGTITFTGTSGTLTATAELTIGLSNQPSFQLSVPPTGVGVSQNASATFAISATPVNGFNQPISVSFSGLPTGVTISPATFTLQPNGSQQLTITSSFSTPAGTVSFDATGTAGSITNQAQILLGIYPIQLSLQLQPGTLNVPAASSNWFELQLSSDAVGTPLGSMAIQITGVPTGVTVTPTTYTAPPYGIGMDIYVDAGSAATAGTLTVTATYGSVKTSGTVNITIGAVDTFPVVPLTTSDQLVPTDAMTPYDGFPPPNYTIYHAATNRFFASDAAMNRLYVVDATSRSIIANLTIPGAFGIDQAPNGSVIYVGTWSGDLYTVDPVNLVVLKRYPSSTISPYGFPANAVYALANGNLILEDDDLTAGYAWVDGNGPIAMWNPTTNDLTEFLPADENAGQIPQEPTCLGKFLQVMLTNNRTRVLMAPVFSSGTVLNLCSLDPVADTWNWSSEIGGFPGASLELFALSSDGNTLAGTDGTKVYVLDPATFAVKNSFPLVTPTVTTTLDYGVMQISADNQSVFITDLGGADIFDKYNLSTGQMTGWIPQVNARGPTYNYDQPIYQAISSSGLAAGVLDNAGIGLLDTTAVHALPVGTHFTATELSVPYGPASGGSVTDWFTTGFSASPPPLGSVYFGANAATDLNNNSFAGTMEAVSPAGSPGPVDVRSFATDGGSQLIPEGFSYGPWVQESMTTYSTADGGGQGDVYGYGFAPQTTNNSQVFIAPPLGVTVAVGGANAAVGTWSPDPFQALGYFGALFPSNALHFTIPPGTAGTTSTVSISNASGSTSASQEMNYLPAVQQYPVNGQLVDGLYDANRGVYYFTDTSEIRVFSLAQKSWLTPIPIPAPKGANGAEQLFGLALSPDGTKLAVADAGSIAIDILNPEQPSSVQSYPYASQVSVDPVTETPVGVAITNAGTVYIATADGDGDGTCALLTLNPSTGLVSNAGAPQTCPTSEGDATVNRLVTSADGSRIYFNDAGEIGYVDVASGSIVAPYNNDGVLGQGGYEVVQGANQTLIYADGFFDDSNLNTIGLQAVNLPELLDADYVYGAAFSADGSLFFQPGAQSIDVFDGRTGAFRDRVALPMPLSANYRALVSDDRDSMLVAITGTGNGIAVIDLNSLPEPGVIPWLESDAVPLSRQTDTVARNAGKSRTPHPLIHRRESPMLQKLLRSRQRLRGLSPGR